MLHYEIYVFTHGIISSDVASKQSFFNENTGFR